MRRREASALAALIVVAAWAAAVQAKDGDGFVALDLTAGSDAYREARARASFDLARDWFLAPSADFFRSDAAPGRYARFGLRAGRGFGPWTLAGDATIQPRVDGYARSSFGGDGSYSFRFGGTEESTLELGAGAELIRHSDLQAEAPGPGRGRFLARSSEFVVRESDLSAFASWRGRVVSASARATACSYDRDLAAADARRELATGDGFGAAVVGFPRSIVSARLGVKAGAGVEPFVSATRTTFALGDSPSTGLEAGASLRRGRAEARASFELYRQDGFADRRYLTVGAALDF